MTLYKATQTRDDAVIRTEVIEAADAVQAMGKFQTGYLTISHDAAKTRAHMTNVDGRINWDAVEIEGNKE